MGIAVSSIAGGTGDAPITSSYAEWLRAHGAPTFEGGGACWQLNKAALTPARVGPCFVERISPAEGLALLKNSGAWFLRYSSDPCDQETEWWYTICDRYNARDLSSKVRNQIKRGAKQCKVERISAEWLAENGYACYSAAFSRYKNAAPSSYERFRKNITKTIGGPFEYWGVFVGDTLAGYCQCIIEDGNVATNVIKLDPAYLKHYAAYALITRLIQQYVVCQGKVISNGTRSIAHDTKIQDVMLKLGFRRQFCRLNVIYRPWLALAARTAFPLRKVITTLPNHHMVQKLHVFLLQEELKRLCM